MDNAHSLCMLLDTRIMLAAVIVWQIGVQLFKSKNASSVQRHLQSTVYEDKDVVAVSKMARLQRRITKLQADNENLATEVVLLRSELTEATSPEGSPTRRTAYSSYTSPQRSSPSPTACRRLPLELLDDGTFRLRSSPSAGSVAVMEEEGTAVVAVEAAVITPDGLVSEVVEEILEAGPSAVHVTRLDLAALEADNKRLAAENDAVRSRLEAIAPGSARNSARIASTTLTSSQENQQLHTENKQLREELERLVAENEDLARRIMEVAFNSFMPEEETPDAAPPATPNWTLAECVATDAVGSSPLQLAFADGGQTEGLPMAPLPLGELVKSSAPYLSDMVGVKGSEASPTGVDAFAARASPAATWGDTPPPASDNCTSSERGNGRDHVSLVHLPDVGFLDEEVLNVRELRSTVAFE